MDFEKNLREDAYHTKLPYGRRGTAEGDAYRADNARLFAEFKRDMFEHYEVTNCPKVEVAFRIAWNRGHSAGYSEVDICFYELVELLLP